MDLRLRAIKLYVYKIILLVETWTLYVESTKTLEALEMRIFKTLEGVSYKDRVTNEEVLRRLEVERGLLSQLRRHMLSYFGNIARHDSLQKTALSCRIDGRRRRGRPRHHQGMDLQPAICEHQASPGSCDLEKRGKSTP